MNLQLAGTIDDGLNTRQQLNQLLVVQAPLGLIFIKAEKDMSVSNPELLVTALPGNYKGVKADMLYKKDKLLGF